MPQIPVAISHEALFAKSQQFIAAAITSRGAEDVSAFPLSAALALELLAKAALANRHPSLIVDVKRNENALLAAVGLPVETRVSTIGADAAYARLKHLHPGFSNNVYEACKKLADARNAHLHSGDIPFVGRDHQEWEPDFWYAAELILETMGKSFEDWLGAKGAALSRTVLQEARVARESVVTIRLRTSKALFEKTYPSKKERESAIQESTLLALREIGRRFRGVFDDYWQVTCPACGSQGVVGGDHTETQVADDQESMDFGWERVEETYQAGEFFCPTCDLRLRTDDELRFAGIEGLRVEESEREIEWEPEYGND